MTPAHDNPNRAPTDTTALYLLATCHCLVKRLLNRSDIGSYSSPHKGARWSPEQSSGLAVDTLRASDLLGTFTRWVSCLRLDNAACWKSERRAAGLLERDGKYPFSVSHLTRGPVLGQRPVRVKRCHLLLISNY